MTQYFRNGRSIYIYQSLELVGISVGWDLGSPFNLKAKGRAFQISTDYGLNSYLDTKLKKIISVITFI